MNMDDSNIFFTPPAEACRAGMRLDLFLKENLPQMSRARLQKLIAGGFVGVDDNIVTDKDFRVREGDAFTVFVPPAEEAEPAAENIPLDVVYEDDDLIVVNKPAGMVVHPAPGACHGTLVNALLWHCRDNLSGVGGVKRPGIVHRIDKDTSGLLVAAKNDFAHQGLAAQFFEHSIERTYYAVVYGRPEPATGTIEGNIARSRFDRQKMAISKTGGKPAVTHYRCLQSLNGAVSLVQCNLETGRTHQIRVHMSSVGCHLVGDKLYTGAGKNRLAGLPDNVRGVVRAFPRQALHAASLGFVHPQSGEKMQFFAPFPEDMRLLLDTCALNLGYSPK